MKDLNTLNPLQALHAQVAYYGITREELNLMTRDQLVAVVTGEADLLEELFDALIIVEHEKFDKKLAHRKKRLAAADTTVDVTPDTTPATPH